MASRILSRLSRDGAGVARCLVWGAAAQRKLLGSVSIGLLSLTGSDPASASAKWLLRPQYSTVLPVCLQQFGFSSSSYPQPNEEVNGFSVEKESCGLHESCSVTDSHTDASSESLKKRDSTAEKIQDSDSTHSNIHSTRSSRRRRRKGSKRIAFSDSDTELELSMDDLVNQVVKKEKLLKLKHEEIEKMQEKVHNCYADIENVINRTKREAENTKKFAIQTFAKSLLDVADNLARASSVVKDSLSKMDLSQDSGEAVQLFNSLLEGVEMTEKQLMEVFRKFGVEQFDPINEQFDPHRHHALFQIPDPLKPSGTVAAVLKYVHRL